MELFPKYVAKLLYAIQFSDYAGQTFTPSRQQASMAPPS